MSTINERFRKYKPIPFNLIDDGRIINLFEKPVKKVEEIVIEEKHHNLIGDLIVRLASVFIPIILTIYGVSFSDEVSKVVGIILAGFMFLGGIVLLPETIKKLRDDKQRAKLIINSKGIKLSHTSPKEFGNFSWLEIKEITIKSFPADGAHLLFITNKGKLIDVSLHLLRKKNVKFLDKDEWTEAI